MKNVFCNWLYKPLIHSRINHPNQNHKYSPQTSSRKFNHKFENHTIRSQTTFCHTKTTSRSQQAFDGLQSPHKINIMCTPHKSRMGQTKTKLQQSDTQCWAQPQQHNQHNQHNQHKQQLTPPKQTYPNHNQSEQGTVCPICCDLLVKACTRFCCNQFSQWMFVTIISDHSTNIQLPNLSFVIHKTTKTVHSDLWTLQLML